MLKYQNVPFISLVTSIYQTLGTIYWLETCQFISILLFLTS